MLVSAAPGWEFVDLAGRHHVGGGSHGSLAAGDSEVPMLTVGLGEPPASITGIKGLLLAHFGVAVAEAALSGAVADRRWIDRQLGAAGSTTSACSPRWRACRASSSSPRSCASSAYDDAPIPLPFGQTISQPYMVALTCEALGLDGDERVLDVGTGSGYAAAVLAELAAEVHTIERIPELAETRARVARRRRATSASRCTSATARSASPSTRRSTRSRSPRPRREVPPALWEQLARGRPDRAAARDRAQAPSSCACSSARRTGRGSSRRFPPASCRSSRREPLTNAAGCPC